MNSSGSEIGLVSMYSPLVILLNRAVLIVNIFNFIHRGFGASFLSVQVNNALVISAFFVETYRYLRSYFLMPAPSSSHLYLLTLMHRQPTSAGWVCCTVSCPKNSQKSDLFSSETNSLRGCFFSTMIILFHCSRNLVLC